MRAISRYVVIVVCLGSPFPFGPRGLRRVSPLASVAPHTSARANIVAQNIMARRRTYAMPNLIAEALDQFLKDSVRSFEAQLRQEGSLTPEKIRLRVQWT